MRHVRRTRLQKLRVLLLGKLLRCLKRHKFGYEDFNEEKLVLQ